MGSPQRRAPDGLPGAPRPDKLRAWQRQALALFEASDAPSSFLAVATPGAGKTAFALTAVQRLLLSRRARRFVVVVPTQHLKLQWAHAAERFELHVDPNWSAAYGTLPSDVHGVAVTYQQVAANPGALRALVPGALVILDEIHHAGESRSWGDGVRIAFEPAVRRLCLSGTPFRSDQSTIPFIRYAGIEARPDFEYGYGEALKDRNVVRPVYFPRINGHMEWTAPGGVEYAATFDDPLTRDLANQRLRTALNGDGEWLPAVLAQAHGQLAHLRQRDRDAAGMVIAMDQDHARAVAAILHERLGVLPVVATSDDPAASRKIGDFAAGTAPWIVAVRMVSEGVDIPRLRVGVYATNTVTELFFRQAVGRLVRWTPRLSRQTAYMFIPNDARLRTFAAGIAEQRRYSVRPASDFGQDLDDARDQSEGAEGADRAADPETGLDEQLSLFTAISAVPLDEQGQRFDDARVYEETGDDGDGIPDFHPGGGDAPQSAPPTPVPLPDREAEPAAAATSALARRRKLREQNSDAVYDLVHLTGKGHAVMNAELNRRIGLRRIGEATIRQLEQRLALAKSMLKRL